MQRTFDSKFSQSVRDDGDYKRGREMEHERKFLRHKRKLSEQVAAADHHLSVNYEFLDHVNHVWRSI